MSEIFGSFIDSILSFFENIAFYLDNLVASSVTYFGVISNAMKFPPTLVGFLPYFIGASVLIVCSFAILKAIL